MTIENAEQIAAPRSEPHHATDRYVGRKVSFHHRLSASYMSTSVEHRESVDKALAAEDMQLSRVWDIFDATDVGGFRYTVDVWRAPWA